MRTKLEKTIKKVNENFSVVIDREFIKEHPASVENGIVLKTEYNIFESAVVSELVDKEGNHIPMSSEEYEWVKAFSIGYQAALQEMSNERNA
jgi:hypothetical protein